MPHKVKLEDGTEIDTFTQEELDAKAKEESDRVAGEKQEELDRIEEERKTEQEELQKLRDKDMNFENLRKKADNKGADADALKKQMEDITKRLDQVAIQPVLETKNEFIKSKVGAEKEKVDLFEYYYKRLGAEAKTKEEVQKACDEALVLASNGQYKPNQDYKVTGTSVSQNYRDQKPGEVSEESKAIGAQFGITAEDRKKYGKNN